MMAVRSLSFAVVLGLGLGTTPALAQGTTAEREACAPDAIRLCQDTIPDVPKTAACMKAHVSELSSSCRRLVVGSKEPLEGRASRKAARATRERVATRRVQDEDLDFGALNVPDADDDTPASRAADRRNARRVVNKLCRSEILDAGTCRITNTALDLAR